MPLGAFKAALMGTAGVSTGDVVLLSSQTADGADELDFTSGIDSTYGEYVFGFYSIQPATDNVYFQFQCNATDTADYNDISIASTFFTAWHNEDESNQSLGYTAASDAAGAVFQPLFWSLGGDSDECCAGRLHLFNPSSTTYAKHFYGRLAGALDSPSAADMFPAGYLNDATAIDDIRFKMSSGAFDGTIKMWGVK